MTLSRLVVRFLRMPKHKNSYHHGDLRQSLLTNATEIIREGGIEALSMRKLADRTGVSRTAPYHHFKDKNELLCAIAEEGFRHQEDSIHDIPKKFPKLNSLALFEQYVLAYIRFADQHPETYDLMFGKEIWKIGRPTEQLKEVSKASFHRWVHLVAQLQQREVFPEEIPPLRVAQTCWATLHGLCRLMNDGIYLDRGDLEEMGRSAVGMLVKQHRVSSD